MASTASVLDYFYLPLCLPGKHSSIEAMRFFRFRSNYNFTCVVEWSPMSYCVILSYTNYKHNYSGYELLMVAVWILLQTKSALEAEDFFVHFVTYVIVLNHVKYGMFLSFKTVCGTSSSSTGHRLVSSATLTRQPTTVVTWWTRRAPRCLAHSTASMPSRCLH